MENVRSDAEVRVEGVWHPAEIFSWSVAASGWWANVRWWQAPGESQLGTFPVSEVKDGDIRGLDV